MGFETPFQSTPNSSSLEKEKTQEKEIGKISRAEKIITAIVSGAAIATTAPVAIEKYRVAHPEYIREGVMDLGEEMNKLFSTKLQVESQNGQYILHIAQDHANSGDSAARRAQVVQYQKDAEKLIRELKQRYGITVYFDEGRTVEREAFFSSSPYQNTFESALKQYREDGHEFYIKFKLWPSLESIRDTIHTFNVDDRNTPESRRHDAETYFALKKNEQLLKHILNFPAVKQSLKQTKDSRAALQKTQELLRLAEATPGFTDQVYLIMGATEKLAREGVIVEKPAETEMARADKPKALFQTFGTAKEFHERREDVSTSLSLDYGYKTNSSYIPIVYGASHDFADAVKRLNSVQTDPNYKVGLIRVGYLPQAIP